MKTIGMIALLSFLNQILMLVAGTGAFVWLLIVGKWAEVLGGLFIGGVVVPFALTFLMAPTLLLLKLLHRSARKRLNVATILIGFLNALYQNALIVLWTGLVFTYFSQPSDHQIAMVLWGYAVALAPLAVMARHETEVGLATVVGMLLCQLSYVLLTVLYWFLGQPAVISYSILGVLLLAAAVVQASAIKRMMPILAELES